MAGPKMTRRQRGGQKRARKIKRRRRSVNASRMESARLLKAERKRALDERSRRRQRP